MSLDPRLPVAQSGDQRTLERMRALEQRLSTLERAKVASFNALSYQTMQEGVLQATGANDLESSNFSSAITAVVGTSGLPLELVFTPKVSCWWRVGAHIILKTLDAAWRRCDPYITLAAGATDARGTYANIGRIPIVGHHNAVQDWQGTTVTGLFKLTAGLTYRARLGLIPQAGVWRYYHGPGYLELNSDVPVTLQA